MSWVFLILMIAGIVGGLLQSVPMGNEYVRRIAGSLIALGFLGALLWFFYLSSLVAGMMMH